MNGADVIREAREWIATRWQHQASLKGIACDCVGLIGGVGLALDVPEAKAWAADPTIKSYGRTPDPRVLLAACNKYLERVQQRRLGDILLMRFDSEPQHFAFLSALDPPYVIHAYAQARKVTEHRMDQLWASRVLAVYRFRGLDEH